MKLTKSSNGNDAQRAHRTIASFLFSVGVLFAGCGGQADTRPAEWKYISTAIIQPGCATASCHSALSQRSGVRLDQIDNGYASLTTRGAAPGTGGVAGFVVPGNPDGSALMGLLNGAGTRRMPPDFPLPADDIDLIGRWITEGA